MSGHSLYLDENWDLSLDDGGQLRITLGGYGIAQGVANAIRLFTDDAWYDPDKGVPHFLLELKVSPDLALVRSRLRDAALAVPGVGDAQVEITSTGSGSQVVPAAMDILPRRGAGEPRCLEGYVYLRAETGEVYNVAL